MKFEEAVKAANQMGLYATSWGWDRERSLEITGSAGLYKCLRENEGSQLRAKPAMDSEGKGYVSLWLYVVGPKGDVLYEEDISFPCPPFYPPGGPPCPG